MKTEQTPAIQLQASIYHRSWQTMLTWHFNDKCLRTIAYWTLISTNFSRFVYETNLDGKILNSNWQIFKYVYLYLYTYLFIQLIFITNRIQMFCIQNIIIFFKFYEKVHIDWWFHYKYKLVLSIKNLSLTKTIGLEECIMGGKMSNVSVLKLGRCFHCVPQLMYGRDRQIENSSKWPDRGPRTLHNGSICLTLSSC